MTQAKSPIATKAHACVMLGRVRRSESSVRRWIVRVAMSTPVLALPGPCATFSDETPPTNTPIAVEAGAPDAPDASLRKTYLSLPDAVRACALVTRCSTLAYSIGLSTAVGLDDFGHCVHTLAGAVPPSRPGYDSHRRVFESLARARDCNAALEAMPNELLYAGDPRCPEGGTSTCLGTDAIFCGTEGFGVRSRCGDARGGPSCSMIGRQDDAGLTAACNAGICPGFTPDAYCEGTVVRVCDARGTKLASTYDCASTGLACGIGIDRYTTCITPGGSRRCTNPGEMKCDGDTLEFCTFDDDAQWSLFECAELGATCVGAPATIAEGKLPFCRPRDSACSPRDSDVGGCDGSRIRLCVDGVATSFDCAAVGKQCDGAVRACL